MTGEREREWCPIPGASGYELNRDCKRVRSVDRVIQLKDGRLYPCKGKEVSVHLSNCGYFKVSIRFDDWPIRRDIHLHRLIAMVFHGPPPEPDSLVRHLNGNQTDNRPENLRWGNKSENAFDSIEHGTHAETNRTECKYGHPLDRTMRRQGNLVRCCTVCVRKWNRDKARRRRARLRGDGYSVPKESA